MNQMSKKILFIIIIVIILSVIFFMWIEGEQRFVVKGRVVEADTGNPVAGASIAIQWTGTKLEAMIAPYASGTYGIEQAESTSDEDGYFEIPKYFLKSFNMGVYKKGYICWSSDSIFRKGLDIDKYDRIKKRSWFRVKNGMIIKLERFSKDYPPLQHASYVYNISLNSGGLRGIGDEIKLHINRFQTK
jgi:hypothetical protein